MGAYLMAIDYDDMSLSACQVWLDRVFKRNRDRYRAAEMVTISYAYRSTDGERQQNG